MGKFKVGDRVKTDGGYEFDPNEGTVVGEINTLVTVRLDEIPSGENKATWSYYPSELLPVATATGRFKVGDRVRVARRPKNGGFGEIGDVGVVDYESESCCSLRFASGKHAGESWWIAYDKLEPVAVAANNSNSEGNSNFQIREGRYYRTRDGRKVGPARPSGDPDHPWWVGKTTYTDSGAWVDGVENGNDLVAEAEPQTTTEILDELEEWIAKQDAANDNGSTAGFTVPVFDDEEWDICGHRDNDDDIVQLSVGELTNALAESLKVAQKVDNKPNGNFTFQVNTDDAIEKLDAIIAKLRQIDDMASELGINLAA